MLQLLDSGGQCDLKCLQEIGASTSGEATMDTRITDARTTGQLNAVLELKLSRLGQVLGNALQPKWALEH